MLGGEPAPLMMVRRTDPTAEMGRMVIGMVAGPGGVGYADWVTGNRRSWLSA